jgi:acetylornithine deacetylase/succinyl-diaminopimelate desuccinylase-like protein
MGNTDALVRLLSNLIQIDTSNPPGNESEATAFLKDWLWEKGIKSEIIECEKGRGNLISRIRGSGGPSLLLLSHIDVVSAEPSRWKLPPFSGAVKEGYVWGRGALDMKSMVAVETMIFSEVVDKELKGDLILAVTADEEKGGAGVKFLLEKEREKIVADYVINEGGGEGILTKKGWLFDIQTAERGVFWYRVYTKGSPAHGSTPGLGINAIERMRLLLDRLSMFRGSMEKVDPSWRYVESLLKMMCLADSDVSKDIVENLLERLVEVDRGLGEAAKAMLKVTMTPTMIRGGVKENIVPYECELTVDCRVPPSYSKDGVSKMIGELFQGLEYDIMFIQESEPTASPVDTPLYKAIEESLFKNVPGAVLKPSTKTGGTDSRYFRKLGIPSYGFQPLMVKGSYYDWSRMIHGDNERISIENLVFSYRVLKQAVGAFMLK